MMMPAAVGSGMLQIATFTDLYFASFIPGAAAALGCKCFLHSNLLYSFIECFFPFESEIHRKL